MDHGTDLSREWRLLGVALMGDPLIIQERRGDHLLILTINRFERRNSFDGATARAMEEAIDAYEENDDLRCAIIMGAGGVFSAGQDLIAAASNDMGGTQR